MKLKRLIAGLPLEATRDVEITGLNSHSKLVYPGNLFIAKKGRSGDGTQYIEEAIAAGAVAILTDFPNPFLKDVVQLIHPNVSEIESQLATRFYADPASLLTIGVTGTNGKTSIAHFVKHLLDHLGYPCGMIGTIEYVIGASRFPANLTTPDVITTHKLLYEMKRKGCQAAVMEVSSIGLDQKRVDGINFDLAIFSNLSQDHLDYHQTMEAYAEAKKELFTSLAPEKFAVVNHDSPWTEILLAGCRAQILSYGFSSEADLYAHNLRLSAHQSQFSVTYQAKTVSFTMPQIGRFNVANCLAAIGVCLTQKVTLNELVEYVASIPAVTGRLQRVGNVFVDYAHTPDALENALECLRGITEGKLICVFGCGGDRDPGKRPMMGVVAAKCADFSWITSDNPRTEDPRAICEEIATGFDGDNYQIEPNRREAITKAIQAAGAKDLILIAGKGHETYQIFTHQTIPFDDQKIAQEISDSIYS